MQAVKQAVPAELHFKLLAQVLVEDLQPVVEQDLVVKVLPEQVLEPQSFEVEEQVPSLPVNAQEYCTKLEPEQASAVVQAVSQQ